MGNRCNGCETQKGNLAQIPFVVYEANEQRHRKRENRLLFIIIFLITAFIISNAVLLFHKQKGEEYPERDNISDASILIDNDGEFINGQEQYYFEKS